jgi:hypothetical protein
MTWTNIQSVMHDRMVPGPLNESLFVEARDAASGCFF